MTKNAGLPSKKKHSQTRWPMQIQVGDLVHPVGITSPDVGEVLWISKTRKTAKVDWRSWRAKRHPMDQLGSVCRSLTELISYQRGKTPCTSCGYPLEEAWGNEQPVDGQTCRLCEVYA